MFTCIIPTSLASSPIANVIALTDTLAIGDEANDVDMIQVNISLSYNISYWGWGQ
jgi:hypothetical protein